MITTATKLLGVIGNPIEHSLSPVFQNWLIRHFDIDAVYLAFKVEDQQLSGMLNGMKAMGITGLNVTIPHKEKIAQFVDTPSKEVKILGACNTLKYRDNEILGFVTDPFGFIESLGENKSKFKNASVLLLGAGGAARSVAFACSNLAVKKLFLYDISEKQISNLLGLCRDKIGLDAEEISGQGLPDFVRDVDIVINATPIGMSPYLEASVIDEPSVFSKDHFVYDLIYNPDKTKLLRMAESRGASIQNGLYMLLFQGLESLRIWTDKSLDLNDKDTIKLENMMRMEI